MVLVAVEPRAYAGAIGAAIGRLRPRLDVRVVEPAALVAEVSRLEPLVVLCSQPRATAVGDPDWVEFYPYAAAPKVRIRAGGRSSTLEDADLEDLLSIIDGARPACGCRCA